MLRLFKVVVGSARTIRLLSACMVAACIMTTSASPAVASNQYKHSTRSSGVKAGETSSHVKVRPERLSVQEKIAREHEAWVAVSIPLLCARIQRHFTMFSKQAQKILCERDKNLPSITIGANNEICVCAPLTSGSENSIFQSGKR